MCEEKIERLFQGMEGNKLGVVWKGGALYLEIDNRYNNPVGIMLGSMNVDDLCELFEEIRKRRSISEAKK